MAEVPDTQTGVKDTKEPVADVKVDGDEPARSSGPPSEQEIKAMEYMDQASKKVKSASSFLGGLLGGTAKLEDAADLYVRAGNSFKVAKKFAAAGDAYCCAARLHRDKLDTRHEAANSFADAASVYRKEKPEEAVSCYQTAIEIYTDMGRFSLAAKYYMTIGEIYETELVNLERAIESYEQAADFYRGEDSTASANKCTTKVAHMHAQLQLHEKAADLFEQIAKHCLDSGLLKYSAKEYFFKALLCSFCHQPSLVPEKMEQYKGIHPAFDGTREQKLVSDLWQAFEDEDADKFAERVQDYDSISRLDSWLTAQLLHIKKKIGQPDDIN